MDASPRPIAASYCDCFSAAPLAAAAAASAAAFAAFVASDAAAFAASAASAASLDADSSAAAFTAASSDILGRRALILLACSLLALTSIGTLLVALLALPLPVLFPFNVVGGLVWYPSIIAKVVKSLEPQKVGASERKAQ